MPRPAYSRVAGELLRVLRVGSLDRAVLHLPDAFERLQDVRRQVAGVPRQHRADAFRAPSGGHRLLRRVYLGDGVDRAAVHAGDAASVGAGRQSV
eukprot:6311195-Prymnesium_polylepis.1